MSSNLASGLVVLFIGALLVKPAYNHLLNVVQENHQSNQSRVNLENSPNSKITVNQVLKAVNELTDPQTVKELPVAYQRPLQNLRKVSEDVVAVFKDTETLNTPVDKFKNVVGGDTIYVRAVETPNKSGESTQSAAMSEA